VAGAPLLDGTYSPSGFIILSSGELECPDCEGLEEVSIDGSDPTGEGVETIPCFNCEDGRVACEHGGQETYPDSLPPLAYRLSCCILMCDAPACVTRDGKGYCEAHDE
jgi:hypothetical protein